MEKAKEKIVITGATSFIGLALIRQIKNEGNGAIAVIRPSSSRKSLINKDVTLIECPLGELAGSRELADAARGCDIFIHLGWSADFENARYNPEGQKQNIAYELDAVEAALRLGAKRFLAPGSQAEVGVVDVPINEFTKENPLNAYAEAKCEARRLAYEKASYEALPFYWPRILSGYGPHDREKTLISSCIRAVKEKALIDMSGCEQIWDYVHVYDLAAALLSVARSGKENTPYPIASGEGHVMKEYIETIARLGDHPALLEGIGKRPYAAKEPMYLVGDISGLNKDTGYKPAVTFEDGIKELLSL
ncbi:MAG: NAD(P)-dependent oxidoreductase [Lachnospiraceae bacterium]|nr:NAD(P)-dependent oxidoreductase [Lachnospiraceae bacterium]